jgi:hypothetical protein
VANVGDVPDHATMRQAAEEITRAQAVPRSWRPETKNWLVIYQTVMCAASCCAKMLPNCRKSRNGNYDAYALSFHPAMLAIEALRALQERAVSAAPVGMKTTRLSHSRRAGMLRAGYFDIHRVRLMTSARYRFTRRSLLRERRRLAPRCGVAIFGIFSRQVVGSSTGLPKCR